MPVNEKILGPKSEEEKEVFAAEAEKFERELAEFKASNARARRMETRKIKTHD